MGQLIWIASYPKSGNTWLRTFLLNYIRQGAEPCDINGLTDLTAVDTNAASYQRYDPRPASQYSIADVQRMRPLVHHDLMALDSTHVFVKTHNARGRIAGVPLITPQVTAGAVYIVRDPRDVAVSYSRHLGRSIDATIAFMANPDAATGGTDAMVHEWIGSWSQNVQSWIDGRDPLVQAVRYESLIASPDSVFGALVRWLGQEPPPERLRQAIRFSAFSELQAQEQAKGFAERPETATRPFFATGASGQWQTMLSRSQQRRIERDHGAVMQHCGYL